MGSEIEMFLFFTWLVGILSAFMDNVLAVATFIPIVQDLGALGVYNFPLWWGMLFAATFFGNLTLIGSTANIVAIGMLERRQKITITFMQWLKVGAVISIQTLAIATILIILQLPFMPR
jgi:Na+/H+ antiporter NhaD/arsenite permease-like protein